MHISLGGFVAGPIREMNWIKVDEEIFDHVGKRNIHCPPLAGDISVLSGSPLLFANDSKKSSYIYFMTIRWKHDVLYCGRTCSISGNELFRIR
jgi:hypothetical protein